MQTSKAKKIFGEWLIKEKNYESEKIQSLSITRLKSGKFTNAFKCELDKTDPIFFVKRKKKTKDDKDFLVEYETLKQLWDSFYRHKKDYLIPRPYGFIDEHELLITEFIAGRKLSNYILLGTSFPINFFAYGSLKNTIINTAHWLADYESHITFKERYSTDESVERFGIKKIKQIKFLDDSQKDQIEKALMEISNLLPSHIPFHLVNSDFKVHNILIDSEKVIVIDWEKMKSEFPIFWMASSFLRSLHGLSINWFTSNSSIKNLSSTFLIEYSRKSPFNKSFGLFKLVQAFEILTFLAALESNNNRKSRREDILYNYLKTVLQIQ